MDSFHQSLQRGGVADGSDFSRETMFTYVIDPDPNYKSSKVHLSETEKQWVLTLLYHEIGGCRMGPIITAQMIRDSYLYFCSTNPGHNCTDLRSLIATSFSPSYLTVTPPNSPNMENVVKAYEYVFEQGNAFYPIKIFSASAYHPPASMRYYWTEALVHWTHGDNPMHWCKGIAVAGGIDCYPEGVNNTIFDYNNGDPKANAHNPYITAKYEDSPPFKDVKDSKPTNSYDGKSSGSSGSSEKKEEKYTVQVEPDEDKDWICATIFGAWCDQAKNDGETAILDILDFVISVMTVGIITLATIGIIIMGYMIMTARDNEAQMQKAKKRLFEIVIGVVAWVLIAAILHLLLPNVDTSSVEGILTPNFFN